jgi:DnaJ-class molecular chaperone
MANLEKPSYYTLLGVENDASTKQIKTAFRKMSLQHHPDRGGNIETFKNINEAHEVLTNDQSRKLYDMHGKNWRELSKATQKTYRREDLVIIEMHVDPISILKDQNVTEKSKRIVLCRPCKGSGYPGAKTVKCTTCNGEGIVNQLINGMMMVRNTCPRCQGKKQMIESSGVPACKACNAQGRCLEEFKHTFTIFAGTPDNHQYIFENVGNEIEPDERSPIIVIIHHKKTQNGITIMANGDIHQTIKIRLDHALHLNPLHVKSYLTDSKLNMNIELYATDHELAATAANKVWETKPINNNEVIKITGYGVRKCHDFETQSHIIPEIDPTSGDWILTFEIILPSALGSYKSAIKQEKGIAIVLENAYSDNKELNMPIANGNGHKRIEWATVRNTVNTPQHGVNNGANGHQFNAHAGSNGQPECRQM